jgi:hypothetical protein
MAEISIGSAVGAGFQLIARKPLQVMSWGLVRALFGFGVLALYAPVFMAMFNEIMQSAQSGAKPSEAAVSQMMSHMMVIQGAGYLAQIAGLFVSAAVMCAVTRAIVHPERGAWAYLRLGAPEFFFAVLSFAAGFVIAIGLIFCAIPFVIVIAILAANHQTAAVAVLAALAVLALIAAVIYLLLRFAFVVPMMVDDGQFHLFDAWSLTKGHTGSLFVVGLALFFILLVAEALIGAFVIALGVAALGVAAGGLQNLQTFFLMGPAVVVARLAPWLIVFGVLAIPLEGCAMAIFIAPWARAYRDIVPGQPVAATPPAAPPAEPSPAVA